MLPAWSRAVTLKLNGIPAVAFPGTEVSTSWLAGPAETPIRSEESVRVPSVTWKNRVPALLKAKVKEPVPFVKTVGLG